MANQPQGRPTDSLRSLYDLPVHSLAFGSFQLSFSAPPFDLFQDERLLRAIKLLQAGLYWAASDSSIPLPGISDKEREAILRAILQLTPPTTGVIEQIDVGGQWITKGPIHLKRSARKRVQAEMRRVRTERIVSLVGRLREFDKNGTFILRETREDRDVKGSFDEDLYDVLLDFFANDDLIAVIGIERNGRLYAATAYLAADLFGASPGEPMGSE
ncbi:MAG: hypothetical protein H0T76_19450 [Nannocystis sp.]|nr:hypothetical protein [Nannocystis sp.]MBA3548667.1 hypothetical protein [Nannocystis sp.]